MRVLPVALALMLLTVPGQPPAQAAKPAAAVDWSRKVVVTTEGGFRMGNPAARVKLVEYGSLACPHCRHFEETGYQPLVQRYVRSGKVSYEFRNYLLNGPDISASLLTRCAGPSNFFPMSHAVFATQPEWQKKFAAIGDEERARIGALAEQQRIVRLAEIGGFPQIAARFGVTPARARQCLLNDKETQRLIGMTQAASQAGVRGTPSFLINGSLVDGAATWEALEPKIKEALNS